MGLQYDNLILKNITSIRDTTACIFLTIVFADTQLHTHTHTHTLTLVINTSLLSIQYEVKPKIFFFL